MKNIVYILIALVLMSCFGSAQDIHFSQFYNSMLFQNPALTGPSECMYRGSMQYRNQWQSISKPYISQFGAFDMQYAPKKMLFDWFGFGGFVYNDKAGSGNLQNTRAMLLGSYNKSFDTRSTFSVSLGFALGLNNKRIDRDVLTFDSQWNGRSFDPALAQNENFNRTSYTYLDMNAGILANYSFSRYYVLQAGASLSHINQPKENFFALTKFGTENRLGTKILFHVDYMARFNSVFHIRPAAIMSFQKGTCELIYGSTQYVTLDHARVGVGLWHRHLRDIIPTFGIELYKFAAMVSYDINISSLKSATDGNGGFEISLTRHFNCSRKVRNRNGFENCPSWQMVE